MRIDDYAKFFFEFCGHVKKRGVVFSQRSQGATSLHPESYRMTFFDFTTWHSARIAHGHCARIGLASKSRPSQGDTFPESVMEKPKWRDLLQQAIEQPGEICKAYF